MQFSRRSLIGTLGIGALGMAGLMSRSAGAAAERGAGPAPKLTMRGRTIFDLDYTKPETMAQGHLLANVAEITPAPRPHHFPGGDWITLPRSFAYRDSTLDMADTLSRTRTVGLLVLVGGSIRYEEYREPGGREVPWNAMSAGKSLTSALVGIAMGKGLIASLDDRMDKYLSWLRGTDYGRTSIRHLLQMSSGMDGSVTREGVEAAARTGTLQTFLASQKRVREPGTRFDYVNNDPVLMGYLIREVTGMSVTQFMQDELWHPLGLEYPGYIPVDPHGMEIMGGAPLFTARDYARLGELYRNNGAWAGKQIIPLDFLRESTTVSAPFLAAGNLSTTSFGYGYWWWLPEPGRTFTALGHFNQYFYVNPARRATIVKLSANLNPEPGRSDHDETMSALKAIAESID